MFAFMLKLVIGALMFYAGGLVVKKLSKDLEEGKAKLINTILKLLGGVFIAWAFIGTSMIWVPGGRFATLNRVYFARSMQPGQIVAMSGTLGPQAEVLLAGFHFDPFITILNEVNYEDIFTVPNGKCAVLSAKDGLPILSGSAFAEPWPEKDRMKMANDAVFFLGEGKGRRGPQTTVLTPGSYTLNPYLWDKPQLIEAVRVDQGTVGVVKSSVMAAVDFGLFKREAPVDNKLRVLTLEKRPTNSVEVLLVPVGAIGVWEEPLPNGLYYVNTSAYKVTLIPTVAQVYEYKGGYKRRTADITVNDKGQITEKVTEIDVQAIPTSADTAIFTKPEGWDVAQELRVIAQIPPQLAPFVVASLGLNETNSTQVVEDRVITPIIRSVVRDVEGGAQIAFKNLKAVLDKDGKQMLNDKGEPKTEMVNEFRAVKVLDLLENRSSLEEAMELRAKPEALKEGIIINEIRLSDSAIPAEMLIARKREQLAQQLTKAWMQEELAQKQRQATENARAQAEQQPELVKAEILKQAAKNRAEARQTEGEGEKSYLSAMAEGQKVQAGVLGPETTAKLQIMQQVIKSVTELVEKNPELLTKALENAHKFVPNVMVTGGSNGGLEGAAAVFGGMMGNNSVMESPSHKVATPQSTPPVKK